LVRVFRREDPPPKVPANNTITSNPDVDEEKFDYEDDMIESPHFIEHLIEAAVELTIIEPDEVPGWRRCFFPRCENPKAPLYEQAEKPEIPDDQQTSPLIWTNPILLPSLKHHSKWFIGTKRRCYPENIRSTRVGGA
jgi:hypothetical protein